MSGPGANFHQSKRAGFSELGIQPTLAMKDLVAQKMTVVPKTGLPNNRFARELSG